MKHRRKSTVEEALSKCWPGHLPTCTGGRTVGRGLADFVNLTLLGELERDEFRLNRHRA
jgi:hypothetical protein